MLATVQISLDLVDLSDAIETASIAIRAGVDWLEAGTPFVLSQGMSGIRELRARFEKSPIVADLKIMDGGYLETELAAKAGASMVVVMGQAHPETIEAAVKAGHDHGLKVMGDNMAMPDPVAGAKRLEDLGCDYVVHHIGYDMRTMRRAHGQNAPTPLDDLRQIVEAVSIPVQAVGGLSIEQATETPRFGAPMVVIGAPLTLRSGDLEGTLRLICEKVHSFGNVAVKREGA